MQPQFDVTDENRIKMQAVADVLDGTCFSVEEGLEAVFGPDVGLDDFALPLLEQLDATVLPCEDCGWWCPVTDLDDAGFCNTCS